MADFTATFDGVPNGAAPTPANTGFSNVPPFTMTVVGDTGVKREGAASLRASGTGNLYLESTFAAPATTRHFGFWIRPAADGVDGQGATTTPGRPSTNTPILYAVNTGPADFCWDVRMRTTGALQLRGSTLAQTAITGTALPPGEWSYVSVSAVNGTLTLRLWAGDAASSAGGTPTETVSGSYATTTMTGAVLGSTATATWDFRLDTFKGRDAGPILLSAATTAPANTVAPTITGDGSPITGEQLTSTLGTWTGTPTPTLNRQWKFNGGNISGANGASYTPTQAGDYRCDVTGTNTDPGSPVTAQSNAITVNAAPVVLAGDPATQADTATIKVTDPTNGTALFTHSIAQLSGPATTARAVGTTGRWWAVERQAEATTWRVTTTDAAGSTALTRDITVDPPSAGGASGSTAYYGTSTGWVEV